MKTICFVLLLCSAVFGFRLSLNPVTNYAVGPGSIGGWGCLVNTSYSSIQVDGSSLLINTGDFSAATTTVIGGSGCSTSFVPYGSAARCDGVLAVSRIDLTGTGYKVTAVFSTSGAAASGDATFSNNNQTVVIRGTGFCGWEATAAANAVGETAAIRTGGFYLQIAPITTLSVNPATNFAVGPGRNSGWGCLVNTTFSKITLNTNTLLVNTGDFSQAAVNVLGGTNCTSSFATYGTAARCDLVVANSQVDLRGTGYKVVSAFSSSGFSASGSATFSNSNQTVALSGTGDCGWEATTAANAAGENEALRIGGYYLQLAPLNRLQLNPATNYAVGPGNINGWGCLVNTSYSSIAFDANSLQINTGDFTGATTTVIGGSGCTSVFAVYGSAARCDGVLAVSRIDLTGTGFKVTSVFSTSGAAASGDATFSNNNQTVVIRGTGFCGWEATAAANAVGESAAIRTGGWYLQLAYL